MKRSEMLEILRKSFIENMNPTGEALDDNQMYSNILQDLEEAGMLPPSYTYWDSPNPKDVKENGVPKQLNTNIFNGDDVNEWEEE